MINFDNLKMVSNACVFIRHGEKDIDNYCLTDNGRKEITKFSDSLRLLNKKIILYSSPENRCIETATIIDNIVNGTGKGIYTSDVLGKPGIQVKNQNEYNKLTDKMRCRDIFKEWKEDMHPEAMNSQEFIKAEMVKFFEKTSIKDGITIYIAQSGTVACTGYSLGIIDYKVDNGEWVDFLDGYVYFCK